MRKGRFDDRTIDAAGKRLIVSRRTPLSEVDHVVSDPQLFTKVKARIAAEQSADVPGSISASLWSLTSRHATAFGVVLALFVVAAGLIANRMTTTSAQFAKSKQHVDVPDRPTTPVTPPVPLDEIDVVAPAPIAPRSERPQIERASYRRTGIRDARPQTARPRMNEDHFYAVSYTGDPAEADTGGRIVRVEMSRSTLFAMGINVPLENDEGTVKADLLIGRDGSTRGIRVVK